jgi:hypothetical protein
VLSIPHRTQSQKTLAASSQDTKNNLKMKFTFLLLLITSLFITENLMGQDRDSPSIDMIFGTTIGSGFTYGINANNIIKNKIGLYFLGHYFNTAFEDGASGDLHFNSSFGWNTYYDTIVTDIKPWGVSFGISYSIGKLLKRNNLGLNLMAGLGFAVKQTEYYTSSTRYYNNQLLSPSTENYVFTKKTTKFAYEFLLRYDFMKKTSSSFFVVLGYFHNCGVVTCLGYGFRL